MDETAKVLRCECASRRCSVAAFTLSLTVLLWCRMWQMVTYLNKDLQALPQQPEHLTEAEALSSFSARAEHHSSA